MSIESQCGRGAYFVRRPGARLAEGDQVSRGDVAYLLRAGSLRSCHRANASADGRAYLARLATDVCPDFAISMGVDAPASASWVSAECRSWCSVAPPDAALKMLSACR
jgi:hypothetical protein